MWDFGPDNHGFDLPGGGLINLQKSDQPGCIDHFCIGVDDFDAERLRTRVKGAGVEDVQGNASDNFSVSDPMACECRSRRLTGRLVGPGNWPSAGPHSEMPT
jgi:hypothetical protein